MSKGGRPHWGKEAEINQEYLNSHFVKLSQFRSLIKEYDPESKFINEWNKQFL
ncbi:MAG: hypothetical protein IT249_13930 [Chitinophagaceae bacterium]|nr:hypothetical protein [Chitinophagaceae bacterium]